eukprot:6375358-Alexandrium_andersonii.AAC.2
MPHACKPGTGVTVNPGVDADTGALLNVATCSHRGQHTAGACEGAVRRDKPRITHGSVCGITDAR